MTKYIPLLAEFELVVMVAAMRLRMMRTRYVIAADITERTGRIVRRADAT